MNRDELKNILPHREPMLLLDEATLGDNGKAYGKYTVKGDEWFLQGHFPGNPIVPGVIQCEMLAQTCCVLLGEKVKGHSTLFTGIDKVKFRNKIVPGNTIEITGELTKIKEPFYFATGSVSVDGILCMSGDFSFALIKEV